MLEYRVRLCLAPLQAQPLQQLLQVAQAPLQVAQVELHNHQAEEDRQVAVDTQVAADLAVEAVVPAEAAEAMDTNGTR